METLENVAENVTVRSKILRLTHSDRLAMDTECPYCGKKQIALLRMYGNRIVGGLFRCNVCQLVWRITVNIKNVKLPDQDTEFENGFDELLMTSED
jgi:predicted RNA-binding Zn-ribbon protein involved in translation (DUF1610 family)